MKCVLFLLDILCLFPNNQKIYSIMDENNNIKMKRAFYTYLNKHKDTIVCTIMEVGK